MDGIHDDGQAEPPLFARHSASDAIRGDAGHFLRDARAPHGGLERVHRHHWQGGGGGEPLRDGARARNRQSGGENERLAHADMVADGAIQRERMLRERIVPALHAT
jgi:hypothetical protein